jgi:tRNA-Thr(GGU) m(6)t(6)A37 methyltransferase TsaA
MSRVNEADDQLRPVGRVESSLVDREHAPPQGDEGAPDAWLVFDPSMAAALRDLTVGEDVIVLTWLHQARRDVVAVHPRGDESRPLTGVFSTRSADRPNPIGLHQVRIVGTDGTRIRVEHLEAIEGTPILDVKPVLGPVERR